MYITPNRELVFVTDTSGSKFFPSRSFEHLACFFPGLLALGAHSLPISLADIDPAKGFGGFWFEVDEGDGNAVKKDQDGAGFALPTDKIMLAEGTCEKTINVAVSGRRVGIRRGQLTSVCVSRSTRASSLPVCTSRATLSRATTKRKHPQKSMT